MDAASIREQLDHPVIDADGHTIEFLPALMPFFEEEGVHRDVWGMFADMLGPGSGEWSRLTPEARVSQRAARPPWWAVPMRNTDDFATATLPALLHERLPSLGIDFAVMYPSLGLVLSHIDDDNVRVGACRALNRYHAAVFGPFRDRVEPVGVVPMHTPTEAIAALDDAVIGLGLKAILIAGYVRRPIAAASSAGPEFARYATWFDFFGLDSAYDYDPFWARCNELGVSVATHSFAMGWDARRSVSNYMANHLGHFAAAGDALCRSLFMGGVTRRFPDLRIAFLEGGVSWARTLLCDLIGHWEKRNRHTVDNYNPAHLDRARLTELVGQYWRHPGDLDLSSMQRMSSSDGGERDEWAACAIESPEDILELFVPNFFFGCEADDPMTTAAFDTLVNPSGSRLQAMFSSDIGHWDVPDMNDVLGEAYEAVEREWLSPDDFRRFVFDHPARFYLDTNPAFFKGTAVQEAVEGLPA